MWYIWFKAVGFCPTRSLCFYWPSLPVWWIDFFVICVKMTNWRLYNLKGLGRSLKLVDIEDVFEKQRYCKYINGSIQLTITDQLFVMQTHHYLLILFWVGTWSQSCFLADLFKIFKKALKVLRLKFFHLS